MQRKRRVVISMVVGALITAAAWLPLPSAEMLFWPGLVLASTFWPEGIESDFSGQFDFYSMFAVIYLGTFVVWSLLTYFILALIGKLRAV